MTVRGLGVGLGVGLCLVAYLSAVGQSPPSVAKVDTEPLQLAAPDRYQIPSVLEPIRRVTLVAPADAIVRSQDARVGNTVRDGQEVVQLDRTEANARLKIAQAEVKEQQANLEAVRGTGRTGDSSLTIAQARFEAAQARAELAQLELDRLTLRAPFSGRVLDSPVSDGQFVTRGSLLSELADTTSLRVLIPVQRASARTGGAISVVVEGKPVAGKIQAVVPLPESLNILRELSSPLAGAWVVLPNPDGSLEPGQRVQSPVLPDAPLATIPARALKKIEEKTKETTTTVQVIRNEYVADVKVRVLGQPGPDRVQITGPLRATDALIVSSNVPLLAGTLIRFGGSEGNHPVEGTSPNPTDSGSPAEISPPRLGSRPAPIGAPGSAAPRARPGVRPGAPAEPPKPAQRSNVPF